MTTALADVDDMFVVAQNTSFSFKEDKSATSERYPRRYTNTHVCAAN